MSGGEAGLMDRLTPLSASFLEAEDVDPTASLAIGSFAVFEGPAPNYEEFVRSIEGRLPLIPRYRQKLRRVAFGIAAPAWVDDPEFDLHWHIRSTALPAPGGRHEIERLLSRVMSRRMYRSRPMWEYWLCEGLEDGRWGLLSKMHHSMVDGVSGTDLYQLVLDPTPVPGGPETDNWDPGTPSSALSYTAGAVLQLVTSPTQAARAAGRALVTPRRLVRSTAAGIQGLWTLAGAARPVRATSLTGTLDGSRRYAWTDVTLTDVRTVRRAHDVSVNDVALAAVAAGFRRLLLSRGELPVAHSLRSLVPVSMRRQGEESVAGNQVSLMLPYLPVDLSDPVQRLEAVHERIRSLRAGHEPEGGASVTTLAEYGPFAPVSWGIRLGLRFPQRHIATVTTNVPGPPNTLYALGRELRQLLPYVPIADRVRIGVAIFSYRDTLTFGLTGDYDAAPDLQVLADGINEAVQELTRESQGTP